MVALSADTVSKPPETQRIAKLLARAGIASRREIERMIAERRIAIDGVALETPATLLASLRGVTVDGKPVAAPAPARLFRFHKPAGVLTAERDPKGRRTIYDVLPADLPRVIPVGRLDLNTEGLLLLTTDGELKRQLELPATQVKRTYRARAFGEVSQAQLEDLIEGIEIDGVRYGSIDANMERRTGANVWIELTLTEGKNREVRRVLEHLGMTVSRLIRTSYGPIPLSDMPVGGVDEVRQHDLIQFRRELRLPADRRSETPLVTRPSTPRPVPKATEEQSERTRRPSASPSHAPARTPGGAPKKAAVRKHEVREVLETDRKRLTAGPARPGAAGPARPGATKPARPGAAKPGRSGAAISTQPGAGPRPARSGGKPEAPRDTSRPQRPRPGGRPAPRKGPR